MKTDAVRISHQEVLEFMAVLTRVKIGSHAFLSPAEARREREELLAQVRILYPDAAVVRTALRGRLPAVLV